MISNHKTLLYNFGMRNTTCTLEYTHSKRRVFDKDSLTSFKSSLRNENWLDIFNENNIEKMFENFHDTFLYNFNLCFPLRPKLNRSTKSWVNTDVMKSSRLLHDLYLIQVKQPTLKHMYCAAKEKHRELVTCVRRAYYQNQITSAENQSRAAWRVIDNLSGKNATPKNIVLISDNKFESDPTGVANLFNNFFLGEPIRLTSGLRNVSVHMTDIPNVSSSIFLNPFTEIEMLRILKILKKQAQLWV